MKDKEKQRAYNRAYREENRERLKEKDRAWYAANREQIRERRRAHEEAHREEKRAYDRAHRGEYSRRWRGQARGLIAEARGTRCWDCDGTFEPHELHFHHRDPETKLFSVCSIQFANKSLPRLRAEIAKCDVLCPACHRARHQGGD